MLLPSSEGVDWNSQLCRRENLSLGRCLDLEDKEINNPTIPLTYFLFHFTHFSRKSETCKITQIVFIISFLHFNMGRGVIVISENKPHARSVDTWKLEKENSKSF